MFPLPDRSWQSRMTEKCAVRNNRFLYRRTCDLTGKSIISLYDPDGDSIVYSYAAWHSDAWDALSFGVDVDFSRSVLEQLRELNAAVPKMAVFTDAACQNCAFAT